ncbi:CopG family transcriptional regulator [Piscinibacter aquaticus]|uniref:CopG family transcriptional regulator n=1 Tax=Piscinibacter aquaticus TaxID=392597 RepID=A0A5C6TZM7_9BURK|nr:CopG family transcriptional regulator [Piscinibacter aquaticus]
MGMTTIRLEEDLEARISAAAEREGKTFHAFIVDAIVCTVERSESEDEFHRHGEKRLAKLQATGNSVAYEQARAYLEARAQGRHPARPPARKLAC